MVQSIRRLRVVRAAHNSVERLEARRLFAAVVLSSPVLVFNSDTTVSGANHTSHTDTLTITNIGSTTLTGLAWTLVADPSDSAGDQSADFHVTSGPLPAGLAPNASANITLNFTASAANTIESALLRINSSDPAGPTTVQLHGLGTNGQFGYNEPSLANILTAFGIPTNIGVTDPSNSQYPLAPASSSQEVPMQRLVKAGSGPVTIQMLAAFNASAAPSVRFGYYTPAEASSTTELFTINNADDQTVNPTAQGATSFDPGSATFSLYANFPGIGAADTHYSETSLNVPLDSSNPQKFRFFPLENADGSAVPDAYVVAAEDYNGTAYHSFTNVVAIIRNVKPAPDATNAPVLGLENTDGLPSTNRMIFDRIQVPNPTLGDKVHDTAILRIHNTGDQPLLINSVTLSDTTNWQIVNPPAAGTTVAANGGTLDLTVQFIAQSVPTVPYNETNDTATIGDNNLPSTQAGGVWNATLAINSNDPVNPTQTVALAGYWQHLSEHEEEMGLQTLVNLVAGYQTQIASTPMISYPEGSTPAYYGEEVPNAFLWQAADPTQPVTVRDIGTLVSEGNVQYVGYYTPGNSANPTYVVQTDSDEGQSVLPTQPNSTSPAEASFTPSGAFGWDMEGVFSEDSLNPQQYGAGHLMRFYALRDANGNVIPNAWLICPKIAPSNGFYQNYDFNDNVCVAFNVRPTNFAATPTDLQAAGESGGGVSVQWQPVGGDSTLVGYNVYRSSSPTGTFTKLNASPLTQASYSDTTAPEGIAVYYHVTATDAAGESIPADAMTSIASPAAPPPPTPPPPGSGTSISFGGRTVATYSDAAGHRVTLKLTGPGAGQANFDQGNADPASIDLTGTTPASLFTISVAHGGPSVVGSIAVNGSLARLSAPTTTLQGDLQVSGNLRAAQLAAAIGGHAINIGSGSVGSLKLDRVDDLTVSATGAIGSLQASSWTTGRITAPAISRLTVTGDFAASLDLTGAGVDLANASVRGALTGGQWTLTGSAGTIMAGSVATGWTGTFGAMRLFGTAGNFAGDLTAQSIVSLRAGGALTGSQVRASGNIGIVTAAALVDADVFAGVDPITAQLPASAPAFTAQATITSVVVTGRNLPFAVQGSNIAAWSLGHVTFGAVDTDNGGLPFGLAAHQLTRYTRRINGKLLTWTRAMSPALLTPSGDAVVRLL